MRMDRRFLPSLSDGLERREVLSGLTLGQAAFSAARSAGANSAPLKVRGPSLKDLANRAFDSFATDFTRARATYLSGLGGDANANASSLTAFKSYAQNRLELLAQQLINNGAAPPSKKRGGGGTISGLVGRQINGLAAGVSTNNPTLDNYRRGTLAQALNQSIGALTTSNTQANSLAVLSQDQAIEASRLAFLNGLKKLNQSRR